MTHNAALEPTAAKFHFYGLNDRIGEFHPTNVCNTATNLNVGTWSSPVIASEDVSGTLPTFNHTPQCLVWSKQFSKNECILSTCAVLLFQTTPQRFGF
jgi:hypothetical protein